MLILVWLSVLLLLLFLGIFIVWALRDDARVSQSTLRATFFGGVIAFATFFVAFTWNTVRVIPKTTHADRLTPAVAAGKVAWQQYVCIDCHTILGNGAYYASDVTKSWNRFVNRAGGDEQAALTAAGIVQIYLERMLGLPFAEAQTYLNLYHQIRFIGGILMTIGVVLFLADIFALRPAREPADEKLRVGKIIEATS